MAGVGVGVGRRVKGDVRGKKTEKWSLNRRSAATNATRQSGCGDGKDRYIFIGGGRHESRGRLEGSLLLGRKDDGWM